MQTELNKKQKQKIANAESFITLLCVAMKSIKKEKKHHPKALVVELCAPISSGGKGNVKDNIAEMRKAVKALQKLPFILFNQLLYEEKIGQLKKVIEDKRKCPYVFEILLEFYEPLFESGVIDILVFMPNWHSSTGANWEYVKAKKLGIKTLQLKDNWEELIAKGETSLKKLTIKI
jgi:hypothetical protein